MVIILKLLQDDFLGKAQFKYVKIGSRKREI